MSRFSMNRPSHHARKRYQLRPRLDALEDRCLLSITEFPTPTSNASPAGITVGPDGNLWFTEQGANKVGEINPTTHAITEFAIPTAGSNPLGITAGPDGNLWFTEYTANQISEFNPTTHAITEFTLPTAGSRPFGITPGPNGNLWFTETGGNAIGMINPTTHAITVFAIPTAASFLRGITVGPDGNLWFAESTVGNIGMINPTTGAITEFAIPTAGATPQMITASPDGNLWFTEQAANQIGKINPTTHAITGYPIPTANSFSSGITAGPDGNLWFGEGNGRNIGMINPTTGAITEYPVPYAGSNPYYGITAGPDGNLWFADAGTSAIGVDTLNSTHFVVTQPPPDTITAGTAFGLTVQAEDSSGNLDSSFNGTVTAALQNNPGGATLGGTLTVTASGGVAAFSGLTLTKAASGYTLVVTSGGVDDATTSTITVTAAAATQLAITRQPPARVTAGSGFGLQAAIEDTYGNVVTSASNTVSVALANNPGGATLGGTTSVTASQGVAAFSGMTLTTAASGYTVQVSSSGFGSATTSAITVTPAAATQVVITKQPPANVTVRTGFGLQAAIEDAYGNVETSASNTVKVALAHNPTGANLGGTLSVKASNGVATFSGLTLNKVGSSYTLQVSSSGLSSAITSPITVTNSDAIVALFANTATSAPDALLAPLVLDSPDLWDGLGPTRAHSTDLTSS